MDGSRAIDAGDDSVLGAPLFLIIDQRGEPRFQGPHVDIGAFESGEQEITLAIDIKPGSFPNSANLKSKGVS